MNTVTTDNTLSIVFKKSHLHSFGFTWLHLALVKSGKIASSVGRNLMKTLVNCCKSIQNVLFD